MQQLFSTPNWNCYLSFTNVCYWDKPRWWALSTIGELGAYFWHCFLKRPCRHLGALFFHCAGGFMNAPVHSTSQCRNWQNAKTWSLIRKWLNSAVCVLFRSLFSLSQVKNYTWTSYRQNTMRKKKVLHTFIVKAYLLHKVPFNFHASHS